MADAKDAGALTWAALTYDTDNLGDDIQTLAALQFLPGVHALVQREWPATWNIGAETRLILNGWWMHHPERLVFMKAGLVPLLISIHLSEPNILRRGFSSVTAFLSQPGLRSALEQHGPVGCRDWSTVELLTRAGIGAYFSGCLTTTLFALTTEQRERDGRILLVDVPGRYATAIRRAITDPVITLTHQLPRGLDPVRRLLLAEDRLTQIQKAKLVVTTRIHAALPCLALGTPVVFVPPTRGDPRTESFLNWFNTSSWEVLIEEVAAIANNESKSRNPSAHVPFAEALVARVEGWVQAQSENSVGEHLDPRPRITRSMLSLVAAAQRQSLEAESHRHVLIRRTPTKTKIMTSVKALVRKTPA